MKTYPVKFSPDGRLVAFEVESIYISLGAIVRLLENCEGVSHVRRRRLFSCDSEIHVRFEFSGHPCVVWEPYGDNSRYLIGPDDPENFPEDLSNLAGLFDRYEPPALRAFFGDIVSLRFLKWRNRA